VGKHCGLRKENKMETKERTMNDVIASTKSKVEVEVKSGTWSPKMCAILGCMMDKEWTQPKIAELCITSDGGFLARLEGDIGFNDFMGSAIDLYNNLKLVADYSGLDNEERVYLLSMPGVSRF
jgi:hypothetical protein